MAKEELNDPVIFLSTIDQYIVCPRQINHPSQNWSTMVYYLKKDGEIDKAFPLFEHFPSSIVDFCPVFSPAELLGSDRDLQHEYAIEQLKTLGYRVVKDKSAPIETDFTEKELDKLNFVKYLKQHSLI